MVSETIELRGHIIDSLILPKVLDQILTRGANFHIAEIKIGQKRADQSFARIEVSADTAEALNELMLRLRQHGAEVVEKADAKLATAPADGVFPDDFYVTTNQQTFVRIDGREIEVQPAMMDSAIAVDKKKGFARALKFYEVKSGDQIVVGQQGIRVSPVQRAISHTDLFQFNTTIGADEPKSGVIRGIAGELRQARSGGGKIAAVAGKAVALTGAREEFQRLIELGYIQRFFTGNAFAVYDAELALFRTSRGMSPDRHLPGVAAHENLLRAINTLRATGGIRGAVEKKVLTSGIMHEEGAPLPHPDARCSGTDPRGYLI